MASTQQQQPQRRSSRVIFPTSSVLASADNPAHFAKWLRLAAFELKDPLKINAVFSELSRRPIGFLDKVANLFFLYNLTNVESEKLYPTASDNIANVLISGFREIILDLDIYQIVEHAVRKKQYTIAREIRRERSDLMDVALLDGSTYVDTALELISLIIQYYADDITDSRSRQSYIDSIERITTNNSRYSYSKEDVIRIALTERRDENDNVIVNLVYPNWRNDTIASMVTTWRGNYTWLHEFVVRRDRTLFTNQQLRQMFTELVADLEANEEEEFLPADGGADVSGVLSDLMDRPEVSEYLRRRPDSASQDIVNYWGTTFIRMILRGGRAQYYIDDPDKQEQLVKTIWRDSWATRVIQHFASNTWMPLDDDDIDFYHIVNRAFQQVPELPSGVIMDILDELQEDLESRVEPRFVVILLANPSVDSYLTTSEEGRNWLEENYESLKNKISLTPEQIESYEQVIASAQQEIATQRESAMARIRQHDRARRTADERRREDAAAAEAEAADINALYPQCFNAASFISLENFTADDDVVVLVSTDEDGAIAERGQCFIRENLIQSLSGSATWVKKSSDREEYVFYRTPTTRTLITEASLELLGQGGVDRYILSRLPGNVTNIRTDENLYELRESPAMQVGLNSNTGRPVVTPISMRYAHHRNLVSPHHAGKYFYSKPMVQSLRRGAKQAKHHGHSQIKWPHNHLSSSSHY